MLLASLAALAAAARVARAVARVLPAPERLAARPPARVARALASVEPEATRAQHEALFLANLRAYQAGESVRGEVSFARGY